MTLHGKAAWDLLNIAQKGQSVYMALA